MKKLSFFLMAMLVSLTSIAAEVTGTLTFDDKAKRTVYTTSQQVWTENGITVVNDKSTSTSNVADYAKPARFYASSKITVKCDGTIKQIVFDCNSNSYATALNNSISGSTVASDKVTVVPTTEASEFVVAKLTAQVRVDAVTVTYVAEEEDPDAPVYTITATSADETMGTVAGAGEYKEGKTVTLTANANPGYEFVKWSNESTDNPLVFEATENVTLTASFQAQTPITIAEANKLADSKTCILKEFTVAYIYKSYIHIQDASGYAMIYASNFGLKVGDVVSGLTCSKSTFNGLPQFTPTCKLADLTVTAGEAPAIAELTTAPTGNYHQVVKLMNLKMTGSFNTSSGTTLTATCPDGKTIAIYNGKNHTYTFVADKTYNITGDVCQYSGKIQVSAYAIEEYVAPAPCTLAPVMNWYEVQGLPANADMWYAINMKSAIEAGENLQLSVANLSDVESVISIEAFDACPAEEPFATASKTVAPGETLTKIVSYDEVISGLAETIYIHAVSTGGEMQIGATPEQKALTYNVTVPQGTFACYIAGQMTQWGQLEMTKVDDTHYTITLENATKEMKYKYCSGPGWEYVEKDANGQEISDRTYSDNDIVASWASLYNPTPITVKAKVPASWTNTITAWVWPTGGEGKEVYPTQEGNWYVYSQNCAELNIIFKNGEGWNGDANQTVDITVKESTCLELAQTGNAKATYTVVDCVEEPEIEWIPMDLEISNLTTEEMEVEGAKYLQLMGRDDMNDADVVLFLNNYTGEEKEYEVNAESSYMTFGGMELTVLEGVIVKKGDAFSGVVRTSLEDEEEGETMYVEFSLYMYAAPATVIELTDAIVAINEDLGTLTFNVPNPTTEGEGYYVELAGYTGPGVHEGPQICLFMTPEAVAYTNYAETSVADGIITLKGNFVSPMGPKFDVTVSGKLPVEEPEVVEPNYTDNNLNTYAFGLESKLSNDNSTLTVTYRLNNSHATEVNVVVYNGEEVVATVPGTTTIGKNTVEVSTASLPGGVQLTWAVVVNGTSVEVPTQEAKIHSFYHPSGLDIDNNPENPTFGMLLINEGMHSVKSMKEGYVSAQFGAGIFAFTPSFDLIPNGELPGYNGGIEFTTSRDDGAGTAYSPRRIRISEDGRIFVTSLNTDGNYLWEVNPANMNEWNPVFKGELNDQRELVDAEGNFVAAPNNGFDVKGSGENLQLAMYSVNLSGITAAAMSGFRLHEYNLGTATEWTTAPSKAIVEGKYAINYTGTQVEYDNEGGLWIASYRGSATEGNPGLVHINANGAEDLKLVWNNVRQAGIRFNKDFTKLVVAGNNGAAKKATIYTISKDNNGAPVLNEEAVIDMAVVGNNLNDFAWDYAGNLYACGNSSEKLVGWAMPYSGEVETPAASKYAFQLEGTTPQYPVIEDEITNLSVDLESLTFMGGPSKDYQIDVYLALGEDLGNGKYTLSEESAIAVGGQDATFISGYLYDIDVYAPAANAVIVAEFGGQTYEFHLAMSAAPMEATVVVVENAAIEIEKYEIFEGTYEYALKMTGEWTDEDGLEYPVLVDIPVYYPKATEPYEMLSTVTVGGWGDNDPWLGFGEGYLTITTARNTITATGIVENPASGIAIDITISGTITPTGIENATVTIKPIKMIKNGQLIIKKGDAEYNVNGAVIK